MQGLAKDEDGTLRYGATQFDRVPVDKIKLSYDQGPKNLMKHKPTNIKGFIYITQIVWDPIMFQRMNTNPLREKK